MAKREIWTVQFFPESGGRARSFRLRPSVAYAAGGLCAGFVLLVVAWVLGFLGERHAIYQLSRFEAENQHLVASLAAIENRTDRLARALDELAAREQRFRVLSGLPLFDEELYAVGIGGPELGDEPGGRFDALSPELASTSRSLTMDLDQLLRRAELLSSSLDEATDSLAAQQDVFARRPTIYPVLDERSWVSSGFSYNRLHPLLGYRRPHPGIDVSASYGSPVVATGDGRVVFAGQESGYGRLVEIDHGYGYRTRYAHLSRATVRVGQRVQRGHIVGEVGRSGLTTGPNLHYEVLVDERPVNPGAYILDDAFRR